MCSRQRDCWEWVVPACRGQMPRSFAVAQPKFGSCIRSPVALGRAGKATRAGPRRLDGVAAEAVQWRRTTPSHSHAIAGGTSGLPLPLSSLHSSSDVSTHITQQIRCKHPIEQARGGQAPASLTLPKPPHSPFMATGNDTTTGALAAQTSRPQPSYYRLHAAFISVADLSRAQMQHYACSSETVAFTCGCYQCLVTSIFSRGAQ
jgi:hypothetical protein